MAPVTVTPPRLTLNRPWTTLRCVATPMPLRAHRSVKPKSLMVIDLS